MAKSTPYLYIFARNDMNSMNAGKAVAHGAHAANQFTYEMADRLRITMDRTATMERDVLEQNYNWWVRSANGFGTTITLHVSLRELQTAVMVGKSMGVVTNETVDPTYPYVLHREYARLIDHASKVSEKTLMEGDINPNNAPTPIGTDGMMLCLREETTSGYMFGFKDELRPIIGNFPLMP